MTVRLVGEKGQYEGQEFTFSPGEYLIGRRTDCDLPLSEDRNVSRSHARLEVREESVWLRDLNSRNGTRVNEELITERELQTGDVVRVGRSRFRVLLEKPLAEPEPSAEAPLPARPRLCPVCEAEIPEEQTYGVCAFCGSNLMPLFKGLIKVQFDVAGVQRLTCGYCGTLVRNYTEMACSGCRLNFVTNRFPDGSQPGAKPLLDAEKVAPPAAPLEEPPAPPAVPEAGPRVPLGLVLGLGVIVGLLILALWVWLRGGNPP